jgi:hypothetical protein
MFREALSILPFLHRGGRPRKFRQEELPRLRKEISSFAVELGDVRSALKQVAASEGVDVRTLKSSVGKLPKVPQIARSGTKKKNIGVVGLSSIEENTPMPRHYRRNATGAYELVSSPRSTLRKAASEPLPDSKVTR